jgi:hypothetical protein
MNPWKSMAVDGDRARLAIQSSGGIGKKYCRLNPSGRRDILEAFLAYSIPRL